MSKNEKAIIVYGKENCQQCKLTVRKLADLGAHYYYIDAGKEEKVRTYLAEKNLMQMPVIEVPSTGEIFSGFQPNELERVHRQLQPPLAA